MRLPASASLPLASCWPRPSVARPALLRHIGPRASSRKWPGLPRAPPLGELAGASPTERANRLSQSRCTAISRLFVRAILSQCKSCLSASLPSPSPSVPPLPKGEALAGRKAQKAPLEVATPRGFFLFGVTILTLDIPDFSIPDSPQKSSAVQKVYSHSSLGISGIFLSKFMVYLFCGLARPFYWEGGETNA